MGDVDLIYYVRQSYIYIRAYLFHKCYDHRFFLVHRYGNRLSELLSFSLIKTWCLDLNKKIKCFFQSRQKLEERVRINFYLFRLSTTLLHLWCTFPRILAKKGRNSQLPCQESYIATVYRHLTTLSPRVLFFSKAFKTSPSAFKIGIFCWQTFFKLRGQCYHHYFRKCSWKIGACLVMTISRITYLTLILVKSVQIFWRKLF
jgi:hypothetical protein